MSLQSHLAKIPEFRRQNKKFRHFLVDILVISVLATLCGADVTFGEDNHQLRHHLEAIRIDI